MISIQQIILPITHAEDELQKKIAKILGITFDQIKKVTITKRAIDSRKKFQMIYFVYSVELSVDKETDVLKNKTAKKNSIHHRIEIKESYTYELPKINTDKIDKIAKRPIIVGSGPCGLFSALILAKAGLKPLVIERGGDVDSRIKDVETFLSTGKLNIKSNIQFGEGGAGTFSDGKLNTLITNPRIKYIFEEFIKAGAPKSILYDAMPHIGTDKIRNVAKHLRKQIEDLGGKVRFNTQLTDIKINNNKVTAIILDDKEEIETDILVLAIGYSARDTYEMLFNRNLNMTQKPFSVGVRIEHKAEMINKSQYDKFYNNKLLGSAKYKLVSHSENARSIYTFCMCPGGYVMPSSSEEGVVVTNGMSEYAQDGENSNSALLANVEPKDFNSDHPLAGIEFQRKLEKKAFELGGSNYSAPVQLVGDFLKNQKSTEIKSIKPSYKPGYKLASLDECLPDFIATSLRAALPKLDSKIKGFAHPDAVLTAIETRSSSPLRITRDQESMQSNISGIYPAGEGAGHAGGIVTSALDGIRVSEAIIGFYNRSETVGPIHFSEFDSKYFQLLEGEKGWIAIGQENCKNQQYFTVFNDKNIKLGIIGIYDTNEDQNITHTVVDPLYRGKGLAAKFKQLLMAKLNLKFITLTIDLDNEASIKAALKLPGIKKVSNEQYEKKFHKSKFIVENI